MNRIRLLRENRGLFQKDLAEYLNVSIPAIAYYENEKRAMDTQTACKLADFFGVSVDYLLGKTDKQEKLYYMVPVYGIISAGQPNWAEENIEGRIPLDTDLMGIVAPEEHFFLRVNGESMNKIVKNGAYALIRKQDMVENGEIAVVLVDGENATLKRFTKQGNTVILSPDSTENEFKLQIYDETISIKVLGKYIGKLEIDK